jgi:hypothetical protein
MEAHTRKREKEKGSSLFQGLFKPPIIMGGERFGLE